MNHLWFWRDSVDTKAPVQIQIKRPLKQTGLYYFHSLRQRRNIHQRWRGSDHDKNAGVKEGNRTLIATMQNKMYFSDDWQGSHVTG